MSVVAFRANPIICHQNRAENKENTQTPASLLEMRCYKTVLKYKSKSQVCVLKCLELCKSVCILLNSKDMSKEMSAARDGSCTTGDGENLRL